MKNLLTLFISVFLLMPIFVFADVSAVYLTVDVFECGDGLDNDGDSLTDYPDDPGCESALDDDETDPLAQCEDGVDNDSDGNIDYPADLGCDSADDDDETGPSSPSSGGGSSGGGGGGGGSSSSSGDASVILEGRAFPLSRITVLQDGEEVVDTITGPDAEFSIEVDDLRRGTYTFSVYGTDNLGYKSPTFSFPISLSKGTKSTVGGIFLAPTYSTSKTEVKRGDIITFFGSTAPNANVTMRIDADTEILLDDVSDGSGAYLINFNSGLLELGDHSTQSRSEIGGEFSSFGELIDFKVGTKNIERTSPDKPEYLRGDINLDGRVNLVDFSVAVFWYQRDLTEDVKSRENKVLNGDGIINLVDFSIMASEWTG